MQSKIPARVSLILRGLEFENLRRNLVKEQCGVVRPMGHVHDVLEETNGIHVSISLWCDDIDSSVLPIKLKSSPLPGVSATDLLTKYVSQLKNSVCVSIFINCSQRGDVATLCIKVNTQCTNNFRRLRFRIMSQTCYSRLGVHDMGFEIFGIQ